MSISTTAHYRAVGTQLRLGGRDEPTGKRCKKQTEKMAVVCLRVNGRATDRQKVCEREEEREKERVTFWTGGKK